MCKRSMVMIYIERNQKGEIISLRRDADKPGMESKSSVDREVLEFLDSIGGSDEKLHLLASTDTAVSRVLEDLVELLVRKNIIMFTELPEEAQQKIQARRRIRQQIGNETIIVGEII